jgi:ATP-dependent Zn protease
VIDLTQRRLDTARHEGGHVLILLLNGIPFKNVEILPAKLEGAPNLGFVLDDENNLCLGLVRVDNVAFFLQGCSFSVDNRVTNCLAGIAGEQIEYEQPVWRKWGERAKGDLQEAKWLVKTCRLRGSLQDRFKQAWTILRQHKAKHDALVAGLLEKSILTYDECVAIWNGGAL